MASTTTICDERAFFKIYMYMGTYIYIYKHTVYIYLLDLPLWVGSCAPSDRAGSDDIENVLFRI